MLTFRQQPRTSSILGFNWAYYLPTLSNIFKHKPLLVLLFSICHRLLDKDVSLFELIFGLSVSGECRSLVATRNEAICAFLMNDLKPKFSRFVKWGRREGGGWSDGSQKSFISHKCLALFSLQLNTETIIRNGRARNIFLLAKLIFLNYSCLFLKQFWLTWTETVKLTLPLTSLSSN